MAGVVTPGASRLRLSHSSAIARPDGVPVAAHERLAHRGGRVADPLEAVEDVRSPSMCFLVISQLLVPELRGSPV